MTADHTKHKHDKHLTVPNTWMDGMDPHLADHVALIDRSFDVGFRRPGSSGRATARLHQVPRDCIMVWRCW